MKTKTPIPKQPPVDQDSILEIRPTLSLRDYQNKHLTQLLREDHPRFGELSDAGTGKTPTVCLYMFAQWHLHGHKTLWVMPLALLRKNREELLLWSEFAPDEVVIVHGTPAQRKKQISYPKAKVLLCGFETFSRSWRDILQAQPQIKVLAGDEWHLGFSNHAEYNWRGGMDGPRRTFELYQAMRHIPKMLPMTGTMINGRLNSAYPFVNLVNPLYYGTYNNFLHWHAILDDFGKPKYWLNHERLANILADHSVRISFTQAYGDEPVQIQVEMCEMSTAQRRAYQAMHEEAMLELETIFLEAPNEAVQVMRCLQIMQHPHTLDIPEGEDSKFKHLEIHVQAALDSGERLIIFEVTVPGQERIVEICKKLGARTGLINGNVKDKGAVDAAFRANELDVVVCAPICAGIGFNWGFVNHMIFSSLSYNDTTFIQNYRRAMRGERKEPLLVTILQYPKSIDQRIAEIVNAKSRDRMKVQKGNDTSVRIAQSRSQVGNGPLPELTAEEYWKAFSQVDNHAL